MSLFGAFGAGCAAISSSTAAVGTSVDRAKCGKMLSRRLLQASGSYFQESMYPSLGPGPDIYIYIYILFVCACLNVGF